MGSREHAWKRQMGPDPRGSTGLSPMGIINGDDDEHDSIIGFPKSAQPGLLRCQTQTLRHGLISWGAAFPSCEVTENVI